jgi:integrase
MKAQRANRVDHYAFDDGFSHPSKSFADTLNLFEYLPLSASRESPVVRFGDDTWDFTSAVEWPKSQRAVRLAWNAILSPTYRLAAKEAAVLLMQPGAAIHLGVIRRRRTPMSPWSLYFTRYYFWVNWLNWLVERGVDRLTEVTQVNCDAWLDGITQSSRNHAVGSLRVFSDYRNALTSHGYHEGFRPFGETPAIKVTGVRPVPHGENKTPEIPSEIFAPLLAASLFVIQEVGPKAVELLNSPAPTKLVQSKFRTGKAAGSAVDDALRIYLRERVDLGDPIPSVDGRSPSFTRIAAAIGLAGGGTPLKKPERRQLIEMVASRNGLRKAEPVKRELDPDSLAMLLANVASGGVLELNQLERTALTRLVRTACLVCVASLTGMRASELATITAESVEREELQDGLVRYRIRGRILKGKPIGGQSEKWLTVREAATAIELASRLPETVPGSPVFDVNSPRINEFVTVINHIADRINISPIREDWDFYLRQFRRTVSREMACRNFGIIATMRALKHQSVLTTEGYAGARGGALSAFQREIELQRKEVNQEEITRIYREVMNGVPVAGLGAKALAQAIEEAHKALSGGAGFVREDEIVSHILKGFGQNLHTGPLAHCWFRDPSLARCLSGQKDADKPLMGVCNPLGCTQATIHPTHAPVWLSTAEVLERSLHDRRIPSGERQRIKAKAENARQIAATVRPPGTSSDQ